MLGIGIDFGTSNSSVAIFDGHELRYVELEPKSASPEVMPTALYLDRALSAEVGRSAIDTYMRDNAGRLIELKAEEIGEILITVAGTDNTQGSGDGGAITSAAHVHAFTDQDMPGRLFRSVKRWLGNASVDRVRVFEARYRIVALVTPILTHLREAAESSTGGRLARVHVGRPVVYEGHGDDPSALGATRMREACKYARLPNPVLYPEPIAAARSFLRSRAKSGEEVVLAFDFGGGTLDLSLVRTRGGDCELLGSHGTGIGGDAIDRLIYRHKIFPELGEGALTNKPVGDRLERQPFPFRDFADRLLNWTLAYELNRPDLLELIAIGAREGGETGRKFERLHAVVAGNQSYALLEAIERAKVRLSDQPETRIELPDLDLDVAITRDELGRWLQPLLGDVEDCVTQLLDSAGLPRDAISEVVRTGGSSRIPAVIELLDGIFPGRVVEYDAFTSIAAGLAIASYENEASPL
jgi:hypothetical chaperone protein